MNERKQDSFWEAGGAYRPSTDFVVELFARQRVEYLDRIGALSGVASLLDVGAGNGFSSLYYPPRIRVVACDYAGGMLARNPLRQRVRCSGYALPFSDAAFDAASCWELLHHLDDPAQAIREMLRVVRKRVVIFEPNRIHPGHILLAIMRASERRTLWFSPRHLRQLVQIAGGWITRHERCGLLFPNATPLALARLLSRLPFRIPLVAISQLVIIEPRTPPPRVAGSSPLTASTTRLTSQGCSRRR